MKKLALAAIACAGLTQATGCIFVSDDDGDTAQFGYAWSVDTGCALGDYVSFVATGPGTPVDDIYDCTLGQATSPSMELGSYTISGSLVNDNGTFDDMSDDFTVDGPINVSDSLDLPDEIVDLPIFAFSAGAPVSNVDFGVDYGDAGGMNCTETAAGGSGVVQQMISVYDVGGAQCLTVNVTHNDPTAPGDFETCTNALCYDNNITQTLLDLPDGDYEIEVVGYKGAVGAQVYACYFSGPIAFTAPTGDLGNIAALFDPAPADEAACNATKPLP